MNPLANDADSDIAAATAQSIFDGEGLPFPPVPAPLAARLKQQGPGWFATCPVASSPYDFHHFVQESEAQSDLADYAVVGFDGHGTNSWAVHFYLVGTGIALFVKLPWGGAYMDPEPARAHIAEIFDWTAALLSRLQQAETAGRMPPGLRLQVAASKFGHAGWRWLGTGQEAAQVPWNPPSGMRAALLQELDDVIAGRKVLTAQRS
ncbi:hypothetical protein [Acidovorax sp. SUPP3334]|uniref:hypothetical protein n=1 Tax=Acidovorax sp. SUPP3334 TaxID=2920881 RepID=UPI0023DE2F67|nr:hypothetical protein [Acidovorax sp. SUPP3334]GKT23833.1 hypothetical protein AVHM3334_12895 [Acidovorax sp. SUPP3334]